MSTITTRVRDLPAQAKGLIEAGTEHVKNHAKKGLAAATLVGASLLPMTDLQAQDSSRSNNSGLVETVGYKTNDLLRDLAETPSRTNNELAGRTRLNLNNLNSDNVSLKFSDEVKMLVDAKIIQNTPEAKSLIDSFLSKVKIPENTRKDSDQSRMAKALVWLKKSGLLSGHRNHNENDLIINYLTNESSGGKAFNLLTDLNVTLKDFKKRGFSSHQEAYSQARNDAFSFALKYSSSNQISEKDKSVLFATVN